MTEAVKIAVSAASSENDAGLRAVDERIGSFPAHDGGIWIAAESNVQLSIDQNSPHRTISLGFRSPKGKRHAVSSSDEVIP